MRTDLFYVLLHRTGDKMASGVDDSRIACNEHSILSIIVHCTFYPCTINYFTQIHNYIGESRVTAFNDWLLITRQFFFHRWKIRDNFIRIRFERPLFQSVSLILHKFMYLITTMLKNTENFVHERKRYSYAGCSEIRC